MPHSTRKLPRKTRTMRVRVTEVEWEYITNIADSRGVSVSEALRWLIHQSILLTTILLENPDTISKARKTLMEMPHLKEKSPDEGH